MPVEGEVLFRSRDEILQQLKDGFIAIIPDVYLEEDGNLAILLEILAGAQESVFLANQILSEDMFIQTANPSALDRHGTDYGITRKPGTRATGNLKFAGSGGTVIPIGAEVAYDPGTGDDLLYFTTTAIGTVPNPGVPSAPVAADAGAGSLPAGTYEFGITYQTVEGETELGTISNPLTIAVNHNINITAISLGGPGTIARNFYHRFNGGVWIKNTQPAIVTALNNNTATTLGVAAVGSGGTPPDDSTAEQVTVTGQSDDYGTVYNVLVNTIVELTDVPDGITAVINTSTFTGGTDEEDIEDFRTRLSNAVRSPATGSPSDIKTWSEEIDGVDSATVFPNDNLGTPTNGHVTVRLAGPNGTVPSAAVQSAVLSALQQQDLAVITVHVTTFTAVPTAVSVTMTVASGYSVSDVTPSVTFAITDYINNLAVGETFRIAGVVSAIMGLPGVLDVTVTTPASNQATGSTSKRTPGTISVT